ncbi:hypothetical protein SAMN02910369_00723 [Lachnospiraceae bacterium NE2001]|nr:hypothetical protein SAMN02910369_00723 [Lachnospiraceae bacterium NE2001]
MKENDENLNNIENANNNINNINNDNNIINENAEQPGDPRFSQPIEPAERMKQEREAAAKLKNVELEGKKGVQIEEGLNSYNQLSEDQSNVDFDTQIKEPAGDDFDIYREHLRDGDIPYVDPAYRAPKPKRDWGFIPQVEEPVEPEIKYVAPEVDPADLTQRINAAKEKARTEHFAKHLEQKEEVDKARELLDKAAAIEQHIRETNEHLSRLDEEFKDDPKGKEQARNDLQSLYDDAVNRRFAISNKDHKKADHMVEDYELEEKQLNDSLPGVLSAAEQSVRDTYAAEQLERLKAQALEKKYADERRDKRERQHVKDEARFKRTVVHKYKGVGRTRYNEDLKYAVDSVKDAPKEDIYKLATYTKMSKDGFDMTKLSAEDLRDAEQVYDRMFMDLKAHYDTHHFEKMDDSSMENFMRVSGITVNGQQIDNVKVQKVVYELYAEKGLDADNANQVESHQYTQMMKAFVLYTMAHQKGEITFKPLRFNQNNELGPAMSNDLEYSFNTKTIPGLVQDPAEIAKEKYVRLTYNQMKALEPEIEEPMVENPPRYVETDPEYLKNKDQIESFKSYLNYGYNSKEYKFDPNSAVDDDYKDVEQIQADLEAKNEADREAARQKLAEEGKDDNYTEISELEYQNQMGQEWIDENDAKAEDFSVAGRVVEERMEPGVNKSAEQIIEEQRREEEAKNNPNKKQEENPAPGGYWKKRAPKKPVMDLSDQGLSQNISITFVNNPGSMSQMALDRTLITLIGCDVNFPEFSDELTAVQTASAQDSMTIKEESKKIIDLPNGIEDYRVDDHQSKVALCKTLTKFDMLIGNMSVYYMDKALYEDRPVEKDPNVRILDILKNNYTIMSNPDYADILQADPDYHSLFSSTFATFPYNSFKQEDGSFKPDDKRYRDVMERIPFLDQIEERQNFILHEYIPYARDKKEGKLTPERVKNYNKAYHEHLDKQKAYFQKIRSIKIDGPDADKEILAMKIFANNPTTYLRDNWQKGRLAETGIERSDEIHNILDRGWSAEDIGVVRELHFMKDRLRSGSTNRDLSDAQKKKAAELLKALDEPMKRLDNEYIISPEHRDEILESFAGPVKEYLEWNKTLTIDHKFKSDAIGKVYNDAVNRKILANEVGSNTLRVETEKIRVDNPEFDNKNNKNVPEKVSIKVSKPAGLSYDQIEKNVDIMVDDLHSVEIWLRGSGEFKEMKEYMEDLQKYTQRSMRAANIEGTEEDYHKKYIRNMNDLKAKLIGARNATLRYLERKEDDFRKDNNRRDSDGRQKTEQSRINMALKNYDKLNMMIDKIAEYEDYMKPVNVFQREKLQKMKPEAMKKVRDLLKAEEEKLKNPSSKLEYAEATARVIVYNLQLKDGYYKMQENETGADYLARMNKVGKTISHEDLQKIVTKDAAFNKLVKRANDGYGQEGHQIPNPDDLFEEYMLEVRHPFKAREDVKNASNKHRKDFKEKLVSRQRKEARAQKEHNKEQARKGPHA